MLVSEGNANSYSNTRHAPPPLGERSTRIHFILNFSGFLWCMCGVGKKRRWEVQFTCVCGGQTTTTAWSQSVFFIHLHLGSEDRIQTIQTWWQVLLPAEPPRHSLTSFLVLPRPLASIAYASRTVWNFREKNDIVNFIYWAIQNHTSQLYTRLTKVCFQGTIVF